MKELLEIKLEIKLNYETLSLNDLSNLVLNITKTIKTKPIAVWIEPKIVSTIELIGKFHAGEVLPFGKGL